MAIKAVAHVVGISPYDDDNVQVEVRIVAKRASNQEMDMTNQVFVVPISGSAETSIRTHVRDWTETNWGVSWGLDSVQLYGATSLL